MKIKAALLCIAALLTLGAAASTSAPNELPSTAEEWRARFDKDLLSKKFKTLTPETQRVKLLVLLSVTLCQSMEHLAALELGNGKSKRASDHYLNAGHCAAEAGNALKKQLPKAQGELAGRGDAVQKLKSFAAVYLAALSAIPRVYATAQALETLQRHDKKTIQDKEAELDVELL